MNLRTFLLSYFLISFLTLHWLGIRSLAISAPISLILSLEKGKDSLGEIIAKELLLMVFPPKYRHRYIYLIEPEQGILEKISSAPFSGILEVVEEEINFFPKISPSKVQKIYLYTKEEVSEWLRSNGIQFTRLFP